MALTATGRAALVAREALKTRAYKDSVGIWTIGVGHTSAAGPPKVTPGLVISEAEALTIFDRDLAQYERAVDKAVTVDLADHERDALVSICYNIGARGFARSTFVKKLNAGDREGAAEAIMAWLKPKEITTRRTAERDQFLTPYSVALPKARSNDRNRVSVGGKPAKTPKPKTDRMAVAQLDPAIVAPSVETVAAPSRAEARAELPGILRWFVRKPRADTVDRSGLKPGGDPALYDIQVQLRDRAYYTRWPPDGLQGTVTRDAVAAARKDHGLGDGGIDAAFLAKLPEMGNRIVPEAKAKATLGEAARYLPEAFNPLKWIATAGVTGLVGSTADGTGLLDNLQSTTSRVNDVAGSVQSGIATVSSVFGFFAEHRSLVIGAASVVAVIYAVNMGLSAWIKVKTALR